MTPSAAAQAASTLTVGEAARRSGVSVDTLRYYEREGLLSAGRTASGHRRYAPHDLAWIAVLTCLRETGMPIRRMREYAALARVDDEASVTERLRMLQEHRTEVQCRLRELQRNLEHLDGKISWYRSLLEEPGDDA